MVLCILKKLPGRYPQSTHCVEFGSRLLYLTETLTCPT